MATSILVLVYRANDFSARDFKPISAHIARYFVIFWQFSWHDRGGKKENQVLSSKKKLHNDAYNFVKLETI